MAYVKIIYQNSPSTATPINAQNLNHMDDGIAENDRRLNELETAGVVNKFNNRTGNVSPEKNDYDISLIGATAGEDGYVPVWRNSGTEQEPNWGFEMEQQGGSGHKIFDADGSEMAQEDALQFADSFVSDDDVNGKTVIENIKEHSTKADYDDATEDGFHVIDDGEDAVIHPSSEDYVEVTGDGVKTYGQLFNELRNSSKFDATKINDKSYIYDGQHYYRFATVVGWSDVIGGYAFSLAAGNETYQDIENIILHPTNSVFTRWENGTITPLNSYAVPQGMVITLYYGNKKAVVDLQTTANRCLYDVENEVTVKQKIDGLIKSISMSATANSSGVIETSLPTSTLVCTYRFGNYLLSPFTSGGFWKFAVCDIDSNTKAVKAIPNATGTLYVYYIDL